MLFEQIEDCRPLNLAPPRENPRIKNFMAEFVEATQPNPFNNRERVWQERTCFEILPQWTKVRLTNIRAIQRLRGDGSAGLDWLCGLAFKHRVILAGCIIPTGPRPRLTKMELRDWYTRHGWEVGDTGNLSYNGARYRPRKTLSSPTPQPTPTEEEK